jgi:hypothetical protein
MRHHEACKDPDSDDALFDQQIAINLKGGLMRRARPPSRSV